MKLAPSIMTTATKGPVPSGHSSFGFRVSLSRGFTLLEMVLCMFILSLLVSAVFMIVNSVTQLSSDLATEQLRDARTHSFVELGTRAFRSLPPEAMVRLRTKGSSGRYLSQLVLAGIPSPVSGAGGAITVLETEQATDGYMRLVLRSLTQEQALAWEKGDSSAGVRVVLLENMATLEWKFFNQRSGEWEPLWNDKLDLAAVLQPGAGLDPGPQLPATPDGSASPQQPGDGTAPPERTPGLPNDPSLQPGLSSPAGLRPSLIELRLAFGSEPPQRWLLWTPPAAAR